MCKGKQPNFCRLSKNVNLKENRMQSPRMPNPKEVLKRLFNTACPKVKTNASESTQPPWLSRRTAGFPHYRLLVNTAKFEIKAKGRLVGRQPVNVAMRTSLTQKQVKQSVATDILDDAQTLTCSFSNGPFLCITGKMSRDLILHPIRDPDRQKHSQAKRTAWKPSIVTKISQNLHLTGAFLYNVHKDAIMCMGML